MKHVLLALMLTPALGFAADLTPEGNREAARLFANYRAQARGCSADLPGRRVLLTGFGLFQGTKLNFTAAVAANIADPALWPSSVGENELVKLLPKNFRDGKFLTNRGAESFQRSLNLGGERINLCVLVLDVLWESAGAIVAFEMNRFQPDAVLLLGAGGGAYLEGGALNVADKFPGYYANGEVNRKNVPVQGYNLDLPAKFRELPMTWENKKIRASVAPLLAEAGLDLLAMPRARASNTYLCNHVSYVALAAAKNLPISLAGGRIELRPEIRSNPRVGLFHLPSNLELTQDNLERWGSLVLSVLHHM